MPPSDDTRSHPPMPDVYPGYPDGTPTRTGPADVPNTRDPDGTRDIDPDRTGSHGSAPTSTPASFEGFEELGRGAMGVVYKATQPGLNRAVAVKMLLGEAADPRQSLRFLAEAEAVAAIDHPHVVRVFEFGRRDGRPFLAMEYLPGGSVADRLAGGWRPSVAEAARLGYKMALGVAAAHAAGIVHRDLKPANVLFDAAGEPKVTDFGLAKRVGVDLTHTQAWMGTPAYMSPEQAKGEGKFVGPAADVWALGVILYECLTGQRPFAADDTWHLLQQVIASEPTDVRRLTAGVPNDLARIAHKCLRKEAADRYPDAAELAEDLRRYLAGEPILARPLPGPIRAWKWVKRNRGLTTGTATVFMALAVGTGVSLWQAAAADAARRDADHKRGLADAARRDADARRQEADHARSEAEAERRLVQEILDYIEGKLNAAGRQNGMVQGLAPDARLKEAIVSGLPSLADRFRTQPLLEGRLRMQIGLALYGLGESKQAVDQYERGHQLLHTHLGQDHPASIGSMHNLAVGYDAVGRWEEAVTLWKRLLDARTRLFGPDHTATLATMESLSDSCDAAGRHVDALELHQATLAARKRVLGADAPQTLRSLKAVARSLARLDRWAEATAVTDEFVTKAVAQRVFEKEIEEAVELLIRHYEKSGDPSGCKATTAICIRQRVAKPYFDFLAARCQAVTAKVCRLAGLPADADRYANRAMQALTRVAHDRVKTAKEIAEATDLIILHQRADFWRLIALMGGSSFEVAPPPRTAW